MFRKKHLKIFSVIFFVLVLSGCTLYGTGKKETNVGSQGTSEDMQNVQTVDGSESQAQNPSEEKTEPESAVEPSESVSENGQSQQKAAPNTPPVSQTDSKKEDASSEKDKPEEDSKAPDFKIINRKVSWGYTQSSGRTIDTIIIHSSYNAVGSDPYDLDDIIDKEYKPNGVSPHYIISRDGKVYRLVDDQNIAYHAGVSKMPDGRKNVNDFSIGIEVVEKNDEGPSAAQYAALKDLINYLKDKYDIKYVLGHSDIAPDRKDDPWHFDWKKLK